jgi:hypothetical protein
MEQVLFKGFTRPYLLATFLLLLVACSPKLNWRTVQSPEQQYTALFPGKPDKLERQIPIGDQEFRQTLEAVKIDDDIYSISSIEIPAKQVNTDLVQKITKQLQSNLLDRTKASGGFIDIQDSFYKLSNSQRLLAKDYFLTFAPNTKAYQLMRIRWLVQATETGAWIYQISILHKATDNSDVKALLMREDYQTFFDSFHADLISY